MTAFPLVSTTNCVSVRPSIQCCSLYRGYRTCSSPFGRAGDSNGNGIVKTRKRTRFDVARREGDPSTKPRGSSESRNTIESAGYPSGHRSKALPCRRVESSAVERRSTAAASPDALRPRHVIDPSGRATTINSAGTENHLSWSPTSGVSVSEPPSCLRICDATSLARRSAWEVRATSVSGAIRASR